MSEPAEREDAPGNQARVVRGPDGLALWTTHAAPTEESTPWSLLLLLTLVAAVLRAIGLNSGLWYDEIRTLLDSVHSPLIRILTVFPGDNQHTLFSVLAHGSIGLFGDHPWSLRLPSMLLGTLTIPVLYLFAREFVGRAEALLASALMTVAYHHIWFSQSARGYAALALLTLLSSWLLMRGLRRQRASDFVLYAIASALGVYTHVTMVFLVASHALLCVLPLGLPGTSGERARRWRLPAMGFTLAAVFSVLLYSPVLLDVQQFVVKKPSPMQGATPRWAFLELLKGLRLGLGSVVGVAIGAALFLTGIWSYYRQSRFLLGMFLVPGALTVAAAVALHRPVRPRFIFFLAGFALLIVVRGALEAGRMLDRRRSATTSPSRVGVALVLVMVVVSLASLRNNYRYPKQDFAGAMRFVQATKAAGESVVTAGPATYPYRAYFHVPWDSIASLRDLDARRAQGRRVWVLYTLKAYLEHDSPDLMKTLTTDCQIERVFRGTVGGGDVTVCALP